MSGARRILKEAFTDRRGIAGGVLAGFAMIGCAVGLMATSAALIARAALQPPLGDLRLAIVAIRLFGIARPVFRYVERILSHRAALGLLRRLRVWFFRALEPLAPARLVGRQGGDLLTRAVTDIEELEQLTIRVIAPPVVALFVTILVAVFVGTFQTGLGALLFGFMALGGLLAPALAWRLGQSTGRALAVDQARLGGIVVDSLLGAPELLAAGRRRGTVDRIDRLGRAVDRLRERLATIDAAGSAFLLLISQVALWSLLVVAIPMVRAGIFDGIAMTVVLFAALAAFEALAPLVAAATHGRIQSEAASRVLEIADAPPAVRFDGDAEVSQPPSIRIERLSFSYPGTVTPALSDIDLELAPGAQVALVGPSGSGKSTLAHLLVRFWNPGSGRILLGERNIEEFSDPALRGAIGLISQRTDLITGTIRDNLLLARPHASDDEIWAALAAARLDRYVAGLPDQLESYIGEQGANLSGGERQRLAIARAVLRKSAILILDEPTAHLDAITAREILDTILAAAAGRTCLLITHELEPASRLDEIVLIEGGRLVARGCHDRLLERSAAYRELWRLERELIA